ARLAPAAMVLAVPAAPNVPTMESDASNVSAVCCDTPTAWMVLLVIELSGWPEMSCRSPVAATSAPCTNTTPPATAPTPVQLVAAPSDAPAAPSRNPPTSFSPPKTLSQALKPSGSVNRTGLSSAYV